ncbi:hypothetical protein PCK1_000086 [Pneumocystis canis]|nr:hypothetical protein PCK1_000086 [Pneumocystis canis]
MTISFRSWKVSFSSFFSKSVFLSFSDVKMKPTMNKHPSDKWSFLLPLQYPYHPPQYPIVLCHGLGFFEKVPSSLPKFQLHYWGSIFEALKKLGCQVYVTKVPSTGTIAQRAKELNKQLSSMVKGKRINLVAHSMGGLDCRYLLSKHLYTNFYPVSLTTLSCPHRGSPFMDWCRDYLGLGRVLPSTTKSMKKHLDTTEKETSCDTDKKTDNSSSISSTILTNWK